ncbi:MAG TPA: MFS transporter [Solirubrobacterales bacterium]|jgi:DHA2 family methylenomycin A resistance protein-like MFS transporter
MRSRAAWAALGPVCLGYFFVLLDVTVVNVALGSMASDLGTSRDGLQWVVDGYALVLASVMLSAGDIGDLLGRRRIFIGGLLAFGASSVVCALAPSVAVLVGARALQGIGAAAILPTSLAIINHAFAESEERTKAIGIWAALGSLALVAGPLAGGILVDAIDWRAIFWLNVPLVAVALALTVALVEESSDPSERSIDLRGQLLAMGALAGIVFFLIEGGRLGWVSPAVLLALVAAILCAVAFVRTELRRRDPMLQLGYFRDRTFSAANAGSGLMNLGTVGALFAFSIYLQQGEGESPIQTGLHILPWTGTLAVFAVLGGGIAQRLGPRLPAGLGLGLTGVSFVFVALLPSQAGAIALIALGVAGVGLGIATPALVSGATAAVPAPRAGMAAAVNNTARQAGGAIGVALIGAIAGIRIAMGVAGGILLLGGTIALTLIGEQGSKRRTTAPATSPGPSFPPGRRGQAPPSSA